MKNQLFTQNSFLVMLMALVLAFSLQGTADALKFSRSSPSSSGDLQTVYANRDFKISFSVSSGSNTTSIKDANGKLIKDSTTTGGGASHRIDSSGYLVVDIGNKAYREITTNPTGTLVIDPRPTYDDDTPNQAGTATSPYYVDTGGNVVDADGKAVYVQTGAGTRRDATDPQNITPADPWKYTRAKADPTDKVPDANRYHYNQEALQITVPSNLTLKKINSYAVNITADHTMNEAKNSVNEDKISGSISLTYTAAQVGTYDIIISDQTPASDRPGDPAPNLVFRVFVVKDIGAVQNTATTFETDRDGVEYGYDTQDWQLNESDDDTGSYFDFGTEDAPVTYSVEGSGRLYIKLGDRVRSPKKTIHTSSDAPVYLDMSGGTNRVEAYVAGNASRTAIFIFNGGTQDKYPRIEITQGHNQVGAEGGRLEEYLEVKVTDGRGSAIQGVAVQFTTTASGAMFIPVPGTTVYGSSAALLATLGSPIDPMNTATYVATATAPPKKESPVFIQTDRSGLAKVYYELGSPASQTITATLPGDPITDLNRSTLQNFTARKGTVGSERVANLEIVSGDPQSAEKGKMLKDPLVVIARSTAGYRIPKVVIQFTTSIGTLSRHVPVAGPTEAQGNTLKWGEIPANTPNPDTGQQIYVVTGSDGRASVSYNVGQFDIARQVSAEIRHEPIDSDYSFAIKRVTFNINGNPTNTNTNTNTNTTTPTLTISTSGEGATRLVTVTASNGQAIGVTLGGTALTASQVVTAGTATTITLPTTAGTYTLTATAPGYTAALSTTVTVAAEALGTLSLARIGSAVNGQQTIQINARTAEGTAPSETVTVTLSGAGVSKTVTMTPTGSVNTTVTLPTTAGTLTASATGYTSGTLALPARTTTTTTTPTPTTTPTTGGEPSRISVSGLATHSGPVSQELDLPLSVRVLDANGTGVEDARVVFRVRTGQGRLSQRGNGRARALQTDSNGYARAAYTPLSARSTVEGSVTGVTRTVTFTITATGSVPTTPDPGGTTGTTAIDPKILVGAANRPAMVWVDNGMLYGLTGAEATKIAENVNAAAIRNGKVYWTEKTGASGGTINSANLDGNPSVTTLATIMAVPMGIAVDTAGKKLYWTNSRGRVQSANLNGSGIRNVQQNLTSPSDIALGNGHIYWTEDGSSIRRVNMTGTKVVKDVAVGLMDVGGIAVGGGKVYWTEKTGASAGTINSANADGTQFKTLATIKAVPMGIAVDTANKKLYWTNSRGRVQSGTLSAGKITNVVDSLGTPSHIAIGSASQGTTVAKPATQPATQPPKKDTTAYDVNGDGTVDNTDASLVSEAMGTDNKTYDVNGDGTVNFFDLMLVFDNRDAEAAAAPTIVGIQLSSAQVDILQEQIDLLIATGDRSPAAMRTLVYLQQLLATARPEKTQLLANYPNPFNPETWIPYELAMDTDVRITIYNAQGVVIRTLQLGQQSAGYYTDRQRAAYWDGRNALGEQVASGIYFYQLETDEMSSLRKMVILK